MWNSQHMPFKVAGLHYYYDFFGRVIHESTHFSYLPINCLIPLVWHMSAKWQHSYSKCHWWSYNINQENLSTFSNIEQSLSKLVDCSFEPKSRCKVKMYWCTLAKELLYQCGPATINGMRWIFYIEVLMCIFHLINDYIIKILIVASTPWIRTVNSTLSVKGILWEEVSTSSLGWKCQNLSICRNSTSIQHFFLRVWIKKNGSSASCWRVCLDNVKPHKVHFILFYLAQKLFVLSISLFDDVYTLSRFLFIW